LKEYQMTCDNPTIINLPKIAHGNSIFKIKFCNNKNRNIIKVPKHIKIISTSDKKEVKGIWVQIKNESSENIYRSQIKDD
jgi:hypothetical protein